MDQLTKEVLTRYAVPGPRYTSYPTAAAFVDSFGAREFHEELRIASLGDQPLGIYVQLPACRHRMASCPCDRLARDDLAQTYVHGLEVEIALIAEALDERCRIGRLHLDGGMSAFVSEACLERLWRALSSHFVIDSKCALGVELIPRVTGHRQLELLRNYGFSRLSLEFDVPDSATAARVEAAALSDRIDDCRELGYDDVHIDLLYSLPAQTPSTLSDALDQVTDLRPDRLTLHNLAHLSRRFVRQRGLDPASLPSPRDRIELQALAHGQLVDRGYRQVGYDHFALPADPLCAALDRKTLQRGLMGYDVHSNSDLVGLGMAAVGEVQGSYIQNLSNFAQYLSKLSHGELPVARGYRKTAEDELRGEVIRSLLCLMEADLDSIARAHGRSAEMFRPELKALRILEVDGLVSVRDAHVRVTEVGRLAARTVAMVFDRHLDRSAAAASVPAQA